MSDARSTPAECLSLERLEAFVREGSVVGVEGVDRESGSSVDAVSVAHLGQCRTCCERLASMRAADEFIAEYSQRASHPAPSQAPGATVVAFGDDFPGYAVEGIMDVGGQAAVYRARQLATGRVVAIKLPVGDLARHPARRYRFRREIELTSRLDHPGIVRVFGVCESLGGQVGGVMEYVEGRRFDEWAEARRCEGREGVRKIVHAALRLTEAIAFAHQRGVLHRDLKPSNVLVNEDGLPRVLDFGLAKALDRDHVLASGSFVTATGAFLGTLAHAAPEQLDGGRDETDVRTDVHGIGLLLYQALAGRMPWDVHADPAELCAQIRRGSPPRPTVLGGSPDAELDAIVLKAIATEMSRRYAGASALAEDLERWLVGRAIRARFDSRWYVVRKEAWRRRKWIGGAALFVVLLGSLAIAQFRSRVADAALRARELEVHFTTITDARTAARDDFLFGEKRVWNAMLQPGEAVEEHSIEGAAALGARFAPPAPGAPDEPSPWAKRTPTSPAYWALWEIFLRTPVVASLPSHLPPVAAFDSVRGHVLVIGNRAIERWDWGGNEPAGRIPLPVDEAAELSGFRVSGDWAACSQDGGGLVLVDLAGSSVRVFEERVRRFDLLTSDLVIDAEVDGRDHIEAWDLEGGVPRRRWSCRPDFRVDALAIDGAAEVVAIQACRGDLLLLDLRSGVELHRRGREQEPQYRRIGASGRPGEILLWNPSSAATLTRTDSGVFLRPLPRPMRVDAETACIVVGVGRRRTAARLEGGGVVIGELGQPLDAWRKIPGLRLGSSTPGLSTDARQLFAQLGERVEARHVLVELGDPGFIRLTQPVILGGAETATIFDLSFARADQDQASAPQSVPGSADFSLVTVAMDGSLRSHCVPDEADAAERAESGSRPPHRAKRLSSRGLTSLVVDGETTYVGTHEQGEGDAKLFRVRAGAPELLQDDGRAWYCGLEVESGRTLWGLGGDGRLFRRNLQSGVIESERSLLPSHGFRALARMPVHGLLIAGSVHPELQLLDDVTLAPAGPFVPTTSVRAIVAHPTDPDRFVTAHDSGVIRVWKVMSDPRAGRDAASGRSVRVEMLRELGAHTGPVFCAAIHPAGRLLATGGGSPEPRDVRLWDLEFGRELAALSLFERGVFSIAFSPDGRWLAAGGEGALGRMEDGGELFLIDLTAAEAAIAGNLEYHVSRWQREHAGVSPSQTETLRRRFGR